MKQLWLIKPLPVKESMLTLDLASQTHRDLVALMARAIQSVHVQQTNLLQQDKEVSDERAATAPQN
jgi:hypothetical protein